MNFASVVRYSDEETAFYDEIFSRNKNMPPDSMDAKKAAEVLAGIGLEKKDLARFWNEVCPAANVISRDQFKLFCKYCAVYNKKLPFEPSNFSQQMEPILFIKNPQLQAMGTEGLNKFRQSKELAKPSIPAPIIAQPTMNYASQPPQNFGVQQPTSNNYYGNVPSQNQYAGGVGFPQQSVNPATPAYQNIYTPPAPVPVYPVQSSPHQGGFTGAANTNTHITAGQAGANTPSMISGSSTPLNRSIASITAADFVVNGTDPSKLTPDDYVRVKGLVERIRCATPGTYTFEELKPIISDFRLPNTKEYTRFWKLVDISSSKMISIEGAVTLFWILALAKKEVQIPAALPPNLDNYVKNKIPPVANLEAAVLGNSSEGSRLKIMEETYNAAHSSADANVAKFKQENKSVVDRETSEV